MKISIALPSGRLLKDTKYFLENVGIKVKEPDSRELISSLNGYTFYFPRVFDVPVYVENGVDLGICGSDIVLERKNEVYVPVGFKIATKYPEITQDFFLERGVKVKILKLNGAVELAAKVGIADAIVDIVDTGNTLRANDLEEVYKIIDISAVLLVNRITQKTKFDFVNDLITKIRKIK